MFKKISLFLGLWMFVSVMFSVAVEASVENVGPVSWHDIAGRGTQCKYLKKAVAPVYERKTIQAPQEKTPSAVRSARSSVDPFNVHPDVTVF